MRQSPNDVIVLLGSRWGALEHHTTRWRETVVRWAERPDVARLTVVDFPRWTLRPTRHGLAWRVPSWHSGVSAVQAQVPLSRTVGHGYSIGWWAVSRALNTLFGAPEPHQRRTVIAATPLWAPALTRLTADHRGFDGVDDWRGYGATAGLIEHIALGYDCLSAVDTVTCVSQVLADRLNNDVGAGALAVPNGVDLELFARPLAPTSFELPNEPFAVYVGVLEQRVDVRLLTDLVRGGIPVVVAGPAPDEMATTLVAAGVHWLGKIDRQEVPGLLKRATVGVVPHVADDFTASMNPLKILEYLAAGLPVVCTAIPGLTPLSSRMQVVPADEFVAAVRRAMLEARLTGPDPAVADRGWDEVAARLFAIHCGAAT